MLVLFPQYKHGMQSLALHIAWHFQSSRSLRAHCFHKRNPRSRALLLCLGVSMSMKSLTSTFLRTKPSDAQEYPFMFFQKKRHKQMGRKICISNLKHVSVTSKIHTQGHVIHKQGVLRTSADGISCASSIKILFTQSYACFRNTHPISVYCSLQTVHTTNLVSEVISCICIRMYVYLNTYIAKSAA